MSFINYAAREINVKIVFYGPGLCGKTTNLQYIYYYALTPTINIGAAPNIIANWEQSGDDRFSVPIGLGINTTVNIGKVPVRFGLEFHKFVIKPDDVPGSDYGIRLFIIPAVPSALFEWMEKPLFGG